MQSEQAIAKRPAGLFALSAQKSGDVALSGVGKFGKLRLCQAAVEKVLND